MQTKTNSQAPVSNNALQKELKYSPVADTKYAAKVGGKKQNLNNRDLNCIGKF